MALRARRNQKLWVGLEMAYARSSGWNRNTGVGSGFSISCSRHPETDPNPAHTLTDSRGSTEMAPDGR